MMVRSNILSISDKIHRLIRYAKHYIDNWCKLLLQLYCELLWIVANSWVKHSTTYNKHSTPYNKVPGTVALSLITIFVDLFGLTLKKPPFPVRIKYFWTETETFCTATFHAL
jgi:hypothetical protein